MKNVQAYKTIGEVEKILKVKLMFWGFGKSLFRK